jgi:hypothetical protein
MRQSICHYCTTIAVQAIQVIISLVEQGISDGKHREGIVEAVLYVERKR